MMGGWESEKKGGMEGETTRQLKWILGDYLRKWKTHVIFGAATAVVR